jgi:hypothetical protein
VTIEDTRPANLAGIQALSGRPAGYAVAAKCVEVQSAALAADPTLRTQHAERLHPDAWSWYQGAVGEIHVGALLDALGPGWFVRHSVPIGAGTKDVDHLVIGPAGVFAVNTKHHRNAKVWVGDHVLQVNGASTQHVKAARRDAGDVSERLASHLDFPVEVTPVLALVGIRSLKDGRRGDRDIAVVRAEALVGWLRAQPERLSPGRFGLLRLVAEEPETWHVDPSAANSMRAMHRFERLRRAVEAGADSSTPAASAPAGRAPRSRVVVARTRRPRAGTGARGRPSFGARALEALVRLALGGVALWAFVQFFPTFIVQLLAP